MTQELARPFEETIPDAVARRLQRLESLYDLSLDIFSAKNIDDLLTVVMDRVTQAMDADRSSLFLVDEEKRVLWSKVAQGVALIKLNIGVGFAGSCAKSGEVINIPDAYEDDRFNPEFDKKNNYRTKSVLCMPVRNREDKVIAVIQAINKKSGEFTEDDEDFLQALAAQIQLAIENSSLLAEIKELFESMIEALASTIDARHPTTAGHTMRVRNYSIGIAEEMGLNEDDLELMNYSALLHDYGKIGVPEAILTKPGKLTDAEYVLMKKHAEFTIDILSKIKFGEHYKEIPNIAGHHHEKVDGTGYPHGLTGEQMHPLSRIMAVADVFDAITSIREYRDPADPDEVLEILKKEAGAHFDPECVAAFERYYKRTGLGHRIRERNKKDLEDRKIENLL